MAGKVYSTLFFAKHVNSVAAGNAATYTVPALKVAVVRSIDLVCYGVGLIYVQRMIAGAASAIVTSQGMLQFQSKQWEGYQVLNAGQTIVCAWSSGGCDVSVSGFLLNL